MNIYGILALAASIGIGGGVIYFQNTQIEGFKTENVLQNQKITDLEAQVALGTNEKDRLDGELKAYQQRKAEIEVRYIKTPVTVYKNIIKTVPAEIVSERANEETNALFNAINTAAINFSVPTNP